MLAAGPSFLSIIGHPGTGKTISAAFLTQYLSQSSGRVILHFFCRSSVRARRTTLYVLRSLLWQLLQHDTSLYSTVAHWCFRTDRSLANSVRNLGSVLTACLQATSVSSVSIIVDALDECLDGSDLVLALSGASMVASCCTKVFFFSRHHVPWLHRPPLRMETLYLTCEKYQASVDLYVEQRLSQILLQESPSPQIRSTPPRFPATSASWLSARLLLDELRQISSWESVRKRFSESLQGLNHLYSLILTEREAGFSEMELRMAQELFLWVDKSEYIPEWLRWRGQEEVLDDEMISAILGFASASNELYDPATVIERVASPLLEVRFTSSSLATDQHGMPREKAHFVVEFTHRTAEDFLAWGLSVPNNDLPASLQTRRLASLYRGVTATWYFGQSRGFADQLQQLRQCPRDCMLPTYLGMNYGLWTALQLPGLQPDLNQDEIAQVGMLCEQLNTFLTTDQCLPWIEAAIISHHAEMWNQLLEHVDDILAMPLNHSVLAPGFQQFHYARQGLMADFIYALAMTWPPHALPRRMTARANTPPHGFYQRPLARKIMHLTAQYQWLVAINHASPNGGLGTVRSI